jgi:ppGpp synthetase/RelA/SpoT-type nucleotidyltranferase
VGVIEDFVTEYERQFDFWEAVASTARGIMEAELSSAGLRAIVTSRAKSMDRLEQKLRDRHRRRRYRSAQEISDDIADLAGVRVALYFPGQMEEAERVIRDTFDVRYMRAFPQPDGLAGAVGVGVHQSLSTDIQLDEARNHRRRFSGYGARHFRVLLPAQHLSAGHVRYASAIVEIQVASVLMHAWSEVEHDLVYKPLEGKLSPSEYALLDQLNGLVLAGEIALEQLQQAGDARIANAESPFRDHYELADFLRKRLAGLGVDLTDASLGRTDVLFDYLAEQHLATASSVGPYVDVLEKDFERRPVADQLADLMLSGSRERYGAYRKAMSAARHPSRRSSTLIGTSEDARRKRAVGEFVSQWVLLESYLQEIGDPDGTTQPSFAGQLRTLLEQGVLSPEQFMDLNLLRDLRNRVVHGKSQDISPERLRDAARQVREMLARISASRERP